MSIKDFWSKCPPVGANKKYLITCNHKPFAGFDAHSEAKSAKEMYSAEIKLKKGDLAFCSKQEWDIILNPDYKV